MAILLILFAPPFVMCLWYTNIELGGSFRKLFELFFEQGFFTTIKNIWGPIFFGSKTAWLMLAVFVAVQMLFMRLLPGKIVKGPETPAGHVPVYKANGFFAFILTLVLFAVLGIGSRLFSPTIIYDHFGELLGTLNLFSLLFCILLYIKGRLMPSGKDAGVSGNPIFDFYWGVELYPRILGWDVKQLANTRLGMMSWGVIILSFAAKQQELHGLADSMIVSVVLQLVYIGVFFWYESGYFRTLDIQHDRAGFYIIWGVLVWLPAVYTSPSFYLVNHPNHLGIVAAIALLLVGLFSIYSKTAANRQRLKVRDTNGETTIWGKKPDLIKAEYTTDNGEQKENLLLASGYWGISRHFHYIPEILVAFCWSIPALFQHFFPYFYVIYLTILLFRRAHRDDQRCAKKYGKDWDRYRAKVPYKIIPGVY